MGSDENPLDVYVTGHRDAQSLTRAEDGIRRIIFRHLRAKTSATHDEIADTVSEILARLFEDPGWARAKNPQAFISFLRTTAFQIWNQSRRLILRRRESLLENRDRLPSRELSDPVQNVYEGELLAAFEECEDELPQLLRLTFQQHHQGVSLAEVDTDVSLRRNQQRLKEAHQYLITCLQRKGHDVSA
ncbi:MAG: hypothetical protein RL885_16915 [Planctomycetota bacterium]